MAKVKVRRTTSYIIEHEDREYEVEFEPSSYEEPIFKPLGDGGLVIGYLSDDPDPSDPRENDNLGVMICWHSRYKLGDEHSYDDPDALWRELIGDEDFDAIEEKYNAETEKWHESHPDERYGSNAHMRWIDDVLRRQRAEVREKVLAKGYTVLPLFLYDHSGITMSTGGFSCPWDSGQVGYIYAGPEQIEKVGCPPDKVVEGLEGEVKEYDRYLTNECFGVCVEVFDADGKRVEDEAVWGHLGSEWAKQALEESVTATVEQHSPKSDPPA